MTIREKIGNAIRQVRKARGISQEAFAYEAQVGRRYLSDVENGKRNLSVELLARIVGHLDLSMSAFFDIVESLEGSGRTLEAIKQYVCEEAGPETIILENPDFINAIIGLSTDGRMVYAYDKMVEGLVASDGMTPEEAMEFIDYNTVRALPYMGKYAPIIIHKI